MKIAIYFWVILVVLAAPAWAQEELTPESEAALNRGLEWLAANQGEKGNWESDDLGLVSMGALAFLSAGHAPGRGKYGKVVDKALDYVMDHQKKSGLLNATDGQRDMYNHGLSTFVLGQAQGMNTSPDDRISRSLASALRLITYAQCKDGGWDYRASPQDNGHDLSLSVMQAKALRSAVDSGLDVPNGVIDQAIRCVREHYTPRSGRRDAPEAEQKKEPGQFTYNKGGGGTIAMAAAGVVCLQEFGQYDDWRIPKNMEIISAAIKQCPRKAPNREGKLPFDAYTFYYVSQALYQNHGEHWKECYPIIRDYLTSSQLIDAQDKARHGSWYDLSATPLGQLTRVGGKPGQLYGTSVACFALAIPNRFLPILQEGNIESMKKRFGQEPK